MNMEDIRTQRQKRIHQRNIKILKFLKYCTKHWIKVTIFLLITFIVLFPDVIGTLIGTWWDTFLNSFFEKLN